jgi:hypothetical protein
MKHNVTPVRNFLLPHRSRRRQLIVAIEMDAAQQLHTNTVTHTYIYRVVAVVQAVTFFESFSFNS